MAMTTTRAAFSVGEANRILPLVRSIVADVVTEFRAMRDAGRERRSLEVESAGNVEASRRIEERKNEVSERSVRIDGYLKELAELGVEVKDLERGLVDFPGERGGRPVYWCWKLGESAVGHWHDVDKGYTDRRPIEVDRLS
jgi:hypothetical protein